MEKRSPVSSYDYCDICEELLNITGTRILKYGTAGLIGYAHVRVKCPKYSSACPLNGKCAPILAALREWDEEAKDIIAEELEEA